MCTCYLNADVTATDYVAGAHGEFLQNQLELPGRAIPSKAGELSDSDGARTAVQS